MRDEQSRRNLDELGVKNTNVHVVADAAFALSDLEALESAKSRVVGSGRRLRVVVSVREWKHFKTVDACAGNEPLLRSPARFERSSGREVRRRDYLSFHLPGNDGILDGRFPRGAEDRGRVIAKHARISFSGLGFSCTQPSLHARLKDYDLVIATRMHMAILALSVGTPVLPIAYEFKMRELFERLAQERWVQDIEAMSGDALIQRVDQFLKALPEIREPLFTAVQKEYENAIASGHLVRQAFEEWRRTRER